MKKVQPPLGVTPTNRYTVIFEEHGKVPIKRAVYKLDTGETAIPLESLAYHFRGKFIDGIFREEN